MISSLSTSSTTTDRQAGLHQPVAAAAAAAVAAAAVRAAPVPLIVPMAPGAGTTFETLCESDPLPPGPALPVPHMAQALGAPLHMNDKNKLVGSVAITTNRFRIESSDDLQAQFPYHVSQFTAGIFLVKSEQPSQAYVLDPYRLPHALGHNEWVPGWGHIFYGLALPAALASRGARKINDTSSSNSNDNNSTLPDHVFAVPHPNELEQVVIKRLKRSVVDEYLARQPNPGNENPYVEMACLNALGDNRHVLKYIEVLQDDTYIYIVTPRGRTLSEVIEGYGLDRPMPVDRAWTILRQLLKIVDYLALHNMHHHDLKPDNLLFLEVDGEEVLVAFDFGMAVPIPIDHETNQRTLIELEPGATVCGTDQWMDPIVYQSQFEEVFPLKKFPGYDGVFADLWAVGIIFYTLLTGHFTLYELPLDSDIQFWLYVLRPGLVRPLPARVRDWLQHNPDLAARQVLHDAIPDSAMVLLSRLLQYDPRQRATLAEAFASNFVQHGP